MFETIQSVRVENMCHRFSVVVMRKCVICQFDVFILNFDCCGPIFTFVKGVTLVSTVVTTAAYASGETVPNESGNALVNSFPAAAAPKWWLTRTETLTLDPPPSLYKMLHHLTQKTLIIYRLMLATIGHLQQLKLKFKMRFR